MPIRKKISRKPRRYFFEGDVVYLYNYNYYRTKNGITNHIVLNGKYTIINKLVNDNRRGGSCRCSYQLDDDNKTSISTIKYFLSPQQYRIKMIRKLKKKINASN